MNKEFKNESVLNSHDLMPLAEVAEGEHNVLFKHHVSRFIIYLTSYVVQSMRPCKRLARRRAREPSKNCRTSSTLNQSRTSMYRRIT